MRLLHLDDIHHTLEGQLVEVETVAHIVVGRYGLWVVVDHHRAPALLANGVQSLNATPVELYGRTDAVSTRTEYDDRTVVVLEGDVALHACVETLTMAYFTICLPNVNKLSQIQTNYKLFNSSIIFFMSFS